MEIIKLIIKGFVIGIAKIIPGLSGSLLAVTLGVYQNGIDAICKFWKEPKKYIPFLGIAGGGILLGILFGSKVIGFFLIHFYAPTMLLFLGLIFGTLPSFYREYVKLNRVMNGIFLAIFLLFFLLNYSQGNTSFLYEDTLNSKMKIILFGFIDATTMIIPGISGTAIFVLLGCYPFILELFSGIPLNLLQEPIYYFAFGLGFGVLLVSKLLNYCFLHYRDGTYRVIFCFALVSILFLGWDIANASTTSVEWIVGLLLFFFGIQLGKRFG